MIARQYTSFVSLVERALLCMRQSGLGKDEVEDGTYVVGALVEMTFRMSSAGEITCNGYQQEGPTVQTPVSYVRFFLAKPTASLTKMV